MQHPHGLLAQLCEGPSTDLQRPLFVDADATRFRIVLDFYRRGPPVHLPLMIDVQEMMKEFEFLNLDLTEKDIVQDILLPVACSASRQSVDDLQAESKVCSEKLHNACLKLGAAVLARVVVAELGKRAAMDTFQFPVHFQAPIWNAESGKCQT
eukprot:gnl/MRDRNA2_/MRDRNA2_230095_c0_seq1.p1 gnl/MRDRNA2_/MRDRNA2_230095_c0~~gnl/MRDRNA2_/MRDRNA2_230095_c0_seq1.p1  ORF type:complete len:153 (+),score=25.18 gnl/MRDRNA2_/MRDRNA2_230095_c0_seq1:139-597(+)